MERVRHDRRVTVRVVCLNAYQDGRVAERVAAFTDEGEKAAAVAKLLSPVGVERAAKFSMGLQILVWLCRHTRGGSCG
jgi:hypothetical protein